MGRPKKIVVEGDGAVQKKRILKKNSAMEQLELKSCSVEELQEQLKATLVDFNLNDILASLNTLSDDIDVDNFTPEKLKVVKADIKAHHVKIYQVYCRVLSFISESIMAGADRIPSNIYNLKDALEDLANGIDATNHALFYMTCKNFKGNIDRPGGKPRYYSETDLDAVKEKAEEDGYQKGLKAAKQGQNFDHIDLLD